MILAPRASSRTASGAAIRAGFAPNVYPQFPQTWAPAYGAALESTGVTFIHGRLDYRKVQNQGTTVVSMFPDPVTGIYSTFSERARRRSGSATPWMPAP